MYPSSPRQPRAKSMETNTVFASRGIESFGTVRRESFSETFLISQSNSLFPEGDSISTRAP